MKYIVTNSNLSELFSSHPEVIHTLHNCFVYRIFWGLFCLFFSFISFFLSSILPRWFFIGIFFFAIAVYLFYKSYKYHLAYEDAQRLYYEQAFNSQKKHLQTPSINTKLQNTEYKQLYRAPASDNNLNYDRYVFSAKYVKTNRIRTKKHITVFADQDIKEEIIREGYTDPIEYHLEKSCQATEKQIDYLKDLTSNSVPATLSLEDASALITRITEHDHIPNPQLFEFATQMHIGVSYYVGKKALYNIIFGNLGDLDRIAFFTFNVYKCISNNYSIANMNDSSYKNLFYEFASSVQDDSSFLTSMNKYSGESLRFFGTKTINGYTITGGSKNTIAFKKARDFLKAKI